MSRILWVIVGIVIACCILIPGAFAWIVNTFFSIVNSIIHFLVGLGLKT